jgi:hypothetical protein
MSANGPDMEIETDICCSRWEPRTSNWGAVPLPRRYFPCDTQVIRFGPRIDRPASPHQEIGRIDGYGFSDQGPSEESDIDRSPGHDCCFRVGPRYPGVGLRVVPVTDNHLSGARRHRGAGCGIRAGFCSHVYMAGKPEARTRRRPISWVINASVSRSLNGTVAGESVTCLGPAARTASEPRSHPCCMHDSAYARLGQGVPG